MPVGVEIRVEVGQTAADAFTRACVSPFEARDHNGDAPPLQRLYLPASIPQQWYVTPHVAVPQFPAGRRTTIDDHGGELRECSGPSFFGTDVGPLPDIQAQNPTPMMRLREAVEAESRRAADDMIARQDGCIAVDSGALRSQLATIEDSIKRRHHRTANLSAAAALALLHRHQPPPLPPAATPHAATFGTSRSPDAAGIVELTFDVTDCNHMTRVQERWSVQSTDTIYDWLRLFECAAMHMPHPNEASSFVFLGGVFATFAEAVDSEDDPLNAASEQIRAMHIDGLAPFAGCERADARFKTFGSLSLRVGDVGVLRHLARCDHILRVVGVRWQPATATDRCDTYPARRFVAPARPQLCDVCRTLPATIMTYFDPHAPTHPAIYCLTCFRLLHGDGPLDPTADPETAPFVTFRLPPGKHF